jgi:hypothetical protein
MGDYDDLRRLAEAATPGPWEARTETGHPGVLAIVPDGGFDWVCSLQVSNRPGFRRDAAFIAAANPQTVLALLDALAAKDAGCERLRTPWTVGCVIAAHEDLINRIGETVGFGDGEVALLERMSIEQLKMILSMLERV